MPTEKRAWQLLLAGFAALLILTLWQWRDGPPLTTDLLALLPGAQQDSLRQQAEARVQSAMSRELVALVGHRELPRALALGQAQAEQLQGSGLFEQVQWRSALDTRQLGEELLRGRLALLPPDQRQLLSEDPARFIRQRAEALFSPFQASPVPLERDWLGLAAGAASQLQRLSGKVSADPASGALLVQDGGRSWVVLRVRTKADAFALDQAPLIAARLDRARAEVLAQGGDWRIAGSLLYAAQAQAQASAEIARLGGGAALGVLALLLLAFRRPRALLALLPVSAGLAAGAAACVAAFGQIHLITLVLGGSLIGVAIDYPLHLFSKRWTLAPWTAARALRLTLPGLALSLGSSLVGYLALAFSPFPALTQIAVFSAAGLLAAFVTTLALAPLLTADSLRPWPPLLQLAGWLEDRRQRLAEQAHPLLLAALLLALTAAGISRLSLDNDLRQWVAASPALQQEARDVAALTGHQPTSQFFLVQGRDEDELLRRQAALTGQLDRLVGDGRLAGYLALNQRLAPPQAQQALREAIAGLSAHWSPLLALGIPAAALETERQALLALAPLGIDAALTAASAEPWRLLWLGPADGRVAGLVTLRGLSDARALQGLEQRLAGVRLIDRVQELNDTFAQTQRRAGELKLLSCLLIVGLLALVLGWRQSLRIIALPLLACGLALAVLGALGQPLSLLGLFGLLLVSALGVDYAILMHEGVGGAPVSLLGILLSGMTAWLSFGLLAFSSTPAVADFGLAVSLGLLFSFLLAPWAATPTLQPELVEVRP